MHVHSLPEAQPYAWNESEYAVVLERYTILDEMFAGVNVYVITPVWAAEAQVPPFQPHAGFWQSLLVEDDPDSEFRTYSHLIAVRAGPPRHRHSDASHLPPLRRRSRRLSHNA